MKLDGSRDAVRQSDKNRVQLGVLLPAIVLGLAAVAHAECDDCLPPSVIVYNFDPSSLRPPPGADARAGADYIMLLQASGGFANEAFTKDPKHDCLHLYGPGFNRVNRTQKAEGTMDALLPPPPEMPAGGDFVVDGTITGEPGAYLLTSRLVAADKRGAGREGTIGSGSAIREVTVPFARPEDAIEAGNQAKRQMGVLFDVIRDYQKKLRDQDPDHMLALQARAKAQPERTEVDLHDTTSVQVKVSDCDGTPLRNRKVELSVEGPGSISPTTVETDDSGVATVKFTAGDRPGVATVNVRHRFIGIPFRTANASAHAEITVGNVKPGTWEMRVHVRQIGGDDKDETREGPCDGTVNHYTRERRTIMEAEVIAQFVDVEPGEMMIASDPVTTGGNGHYDITVLEAGSAQCGIVRAWHKWSEQSGVLDPVSLKSLNFMYSPGKIQILGSALLLPGPGKIQQWERLEDGKVNSSSADIPLAGVISVSGEASVTPEALQQGHFEIHVKQDVPNPSDQSKDHYSLDVDIRELKKLENKP